MANKKKWTKKEITGFKNMILGKRSKVLEEYEISKERADDMLNSDNSNAIYSSHMADAGTDSFEREKGYHYINRKTDYHKSLTKALERIEDGTFGVCTISGELIPEERMLEVPNATKTVEAKEKEKLNI